MSDVFVRSEDTVERACDNCYIHKRRCTGDGVPPCAACVQKGLDCSYSPSYDRAPARTVHLCDRTCASMTPHRTRRCLPPSALAPPPLPPPPPLQRAVRTSRPRRRRTLDADADDEAALPLKRPSTGGSSAHQPPPPRTRPPLPPGAGGWDAAAWGCGSDQLAAPLTHVPRLSPSSATGLLGLREHHFLAAFVSAYAATLIQYEAEFQPAIVEIMRAAGGGGGGGGSSGGSGRGDLPLADAAPPSAPQASLCSLWTAISVGAGAAAAQSALLLTKTSQLLLMLLRLLSLLPPLPLTSPPPPLPPPPPPPPLRRFGAMVQGASVYAPEVRGYLRCAERAAHAAHQREGPTLTTLHAFMMLTNVYVMLEDFNKLGVYLETTTDIAKSNPNPSPAHESETAGGAPHPSVSRAPFVYISPHARDRLGVYLETTTDIAKSIARAHARALARLHDRDELHATVSVPPPLQENTWFLLESSAADSQPGRGAALRLAPGLIARSGHNTHLEASLLNAVADCELYGSEGAHTLLSGRHLRG
ncbi:hypothetical protein JKP88DRAFT_350564 [Tribonema minus]|uniref:Zn(2)-C6 fungal-type domain-containing protein n=1 Tax=Tribonema minus TaxID=303371 RepID=A0A835YWD8_9STRA|nr:hypothetical protein JKP88DRAFT_350564 [Tribonema minus]